ncbi:tyrosine-type recombinase/integrase [Acinetobacter sichuanensis]|uniref:DUF4102 domain-containing protein n=1 Tax=Acinetobacter sichuanensis TaxID=2136183 RepID=A0A371YMN4_9GAMM|nr:site-specific integrase [Acinetobacter sichuanensis]RFC82737.1 DUF4102 domain-containing protein [Acinetobacter sichuanensis]
MSNQKTKLTKTFVDSVPLSPNKQVFYRDSDLIGFALRVTASKVYVVERRIGDGKSSVRVLVGRHGELTPAQAREKAQMLLAQMAAGINPNNEKKKDKDLKLVNYAKETQQPTLMTAYNAYINERELGVKSLEDYRMCVEDYLVEWKDVKLIDITRKMIQEKHVELTIRSKARANLAMRFLRAVFNFSIEHYLDVNDKSILDISNPVNTLGAKKAWNKIKRRKGYIRKDQIHDWVHTVLSTEWVGQNYYNHNAYTNQDFLLIVLLTGFRREETESLKWQDVDLKYGTVTSVDPKNGEPITLPMGPILKHIMQARFERSGGKPYVFQARQGDGHVTNRSKARYKITELSGIEFTYHDLRRTFSSIANSINIGSYTIKRLINHSLDEADVTDGYIQVSFEDLHSAMMKIEQAVFTDQHFDMIKNRKFKAPTRHHDYLEKAMSLKLEENSLSAISKIDQLKVLMNPLENHTKQK